MGGGIEYSGQEREMPTGVRKAYQRGIEQCAEIEVYSGISLHG